MTPETILDHADRGVLWPDADAATIPDDPADAYRTALAVRALRIARGERPTGYKVGFTNRTIWTRYGVFAPIWGTTWDSTVLTCDGEGLVDLSGTVQPRIEPETVFGIAATPPGEPSLAALFDCIEWLAPGFEIVQSHRPDWRFTAAQSIADGALHARLLVGPRTPVRNVAADGPSLDRMLAASRLTLFAGERRVDDGTGANVLDGPLAALRHFVVELGRTPGAPRLLPGDVVTTGTWTDAWPVAPGQRWRLSTDGPLVPLSVTFG